MQSCHPFIYYHWYVSDNISYKKPRHYCVFQNTFQIFAGAFVEFLPVYCGSTVTWWLDDVFTQISHKCISSEVMSTLQFISNRLTVNNNRTPRSGLFCSYKVLIGRFLLCCFWWGQMCWLELMNISALQWWHRNLGLSHAVQRLPHVLGIMSAVRTAILDSCSTYSKLVKNI